MALFTDGPASAIEDLTTQDSQLLNVASAEGIDLTAKLTLAHEALGIELEELLRDSSAAALNHVVTTPELRLWHTYRTLEAVYRDAYNSQLNDRYAGKRDQFRELGMWARERLRQNGVGIAARPVPRACAPELQPASGSAPSGTYFVTVAWVNATGAEGSPALPVTVSADNGGFVVVPPAAPDSISGWNVYAGASPESMWRQNPALLQATVTWTQTDAPGRGATPRDGQPPDHYHRLPRKMQRG